MKCLVFLDVDGTLTPVVSIWQYLLEQVGRWKGDGDKNLEQFLAGTIDYVEFCHRDARLFTGMRYADLKALAYAVPKRPGFEHLLGHFVGQGDSVCLLSSGLKLLTDFFRERFAIPHCFVNDLAQCGGVCTGEAIVNVADHDKGRIARGLIDQLEPERVIAIGDSRGDLPVFALADVSIAVGASHPAVRAAATWCCERGELSALVPLLISDARKAREAAC
jgi:phosphoserine phosphatase